MQKIVEPSAEELVNVALFSPFGILIILLGTSISFYAGYLSAKKSGGNIWKTAIVVCTISTVYSLLVSDPESSLIEDIFFIMTILAILGS